MKTKIILLCTLCALAVCSIHAQSGPIAEPMLAQSYLPPGLRAKQFGNVVIDANRLTYLHGTINSVKNGIVTLDIYKSTYHALPAEGNARIGAYSAGGSGYSVKEFDRTVAITNLPDLRNATINKEIRVSAMRIGTLTVKGDPLEFYDCGTRYFPPPPTPEQIKAAQDAAQARAIADKKKAEQGQVNAVKWLQSQATNGSASAQCSLGIHYLNGQGCETNREQAIYWLTQAANQGDQEASNKLASLQK